MTDERHPAAGRAAPADPAGRQGTAGPAAGTAGPADGPAAGPVALWRRQPLRVRLVVMFTALLLLALVTVGSLALTLLRQSLLAEIDGQLTGAAQSLVEQSWQGSLSDHDDPTNPLVPSEYAVLIATIDGSVVVEDVATAGRPAVGSLAITDVERRGSQPFTTGSAAGDTRWRAVVAPLTSADGRIIGTAAVALPLTSVDATMRRMVGALMAVSGGVLLVAGVATYAVVRRSLQPLRRMETTAAAIAAGDMSQRVTDPPPPSTEVGSLAASINTMLGDLEEAFDAQRASEERMQRFVGDASHELRTPLATVAGYTELYRMGGIPDSELPGVMGRIEDSATRMSSLVVELLTLARLDQGAPLRIEPVPLAPVLESAAADLRALDPTRTVQVHLEPGAAVAVDRAAFQQVLTNLVGNAAAYSPAGTPVELVAGRLPGGLVRLEVRDHGPGVPAADRERIFERFARLDAGRSRDAGGSGLGLSIVRSSVVAMGGTVVCDDTPDGGATFRVELPAA